jgi:hypothetical protein
MIASVRMRWLFHSQLKPSLKSERKLFLVGKESVSVRGFGIFIEKTKTAAKPNDAPFTPKGIDAATTNAIAPSGSPMKLLQIVSTIVKRPLAL